MSAQQPPTAAPAPTTAAPSQPSTEDARRVRAARTEEMIANARRPPERLMIVERMLLPPQLMRHSVLSRELARRWRCTERTIHNYIRQVYARWKIQDAAEREQKTEIVEAMLIEAYKNARDDKQHGAAVHAVDRLARLRGLYPEMALRIAGRVQHQHDHLHAHVTTPEAAKLAAASLRAYSQEDLDALEALDRKAISAVSTIVGTATPAPEVGADADDADGASAADHGGAVPA